MNANCQQERYDVQINDLLPQVLKKWRIILLIGIIMAVLFGLFRVTPLYNIVSSDALYSGDAAERELLQKSVSRLQSEVALKEQELKESIYYNLEPSMITRGYISYYVDAPLNIESLGYQRSLVSLYAAYFNSGEIYNKVANKLNEFIKPVYLSQIVKVETKEPSSFNIYVMGTNKKQADEIMQLLKQEIKNKQSEFSNLVVDHTVRLVFENIEVVSDSDVMDDQIFQNQRYEALKTELSDKIYQLQSIEPSANTTINTFVIGLKFALIGFFVGIALTIMYFSIIVILFNKIISRKQIINICKLDVVGEFIQEKYKKNKIDVLISKLADEPYNMPKEETNLVIANNIKAMSKSKKILIVGCKAVTNIEKIHDGISSCSLLKDYDISFSNKALSHNETLENVIAAGSVIIILKRNKTSLDELQNVICTIDNYKKDLVGVILT